MQFERSTRWFSGALMKGGVLLPAAIERLQLILTKSRGQIGCLGMQRGKKEGSIAENSGGRLRHIDVRSGSKRSIEPLDGLK